MEYINFPLILVCLCLAMLAVSLFSFLFNRGGEKGWFVEQVNSFLPVVLLVLILRSFVFEPFQIPSGSMIPTLKIGDFILVDKFSYGLRLPVLRNKILEVGEPQRGDVVVFFPPHQQIYYIKRVIGVPGDHIQYKNKLLKVNGVPLDYSGFERSEGEMIGFEQLGESNHQVRIETDHDFALANLKYAPDLEKGITVKPGHYFMMGDNRDRSSDSRAWGQVSEDNIVGKAKYVWMHCPALSECFNFKAARKIQ